MPDQTAVTLRKQYEDRIAGLKSRLSEEPASNPIRQMGYEVSRELESGELGLDTIGALVRGIADDGFMQRAGRLSGYVGPVEIDRNEKRLKDFVKRLAADQDFDAFKSQWEAQHFGCIFTAHPTFLMSRDLSKALTSAAEGQQPEIPEHRPDPEITLESEHEDALAAIRNARVARRKLFETLVDTAREAYDGWKSFTPRTVHLGTWIGYDMDGRTDIEWTDVIGFRLREKACQLRHYIGVLDDIGAKSADGVKKKLEDALALAEEDTAHFSGLDKTPETLVKASDHLTTGNGHRLSSLKEVIAELDTVIDGADDDTAAKLCVLRSEMASSGLGPARVHFRINATQLHNAIRRRFDLGEEEELFSRTGLNELSRRIAEAEHLRVNFAAVALETTTAVRQFLCMAQILKHIDSDTPIRMLIAESETPVTVLSAIYFVKLFGLEDHVDVSPLFETEHALEMAGRFLDVLFGVPAYREAVQRRKMMCFQTGFSDAGRFMGQIPATLAIERLQGRVAKLADKHGLHDVGVLIFNTHGESMGRGAHPASMAARVDYVLSPWARSRFAHNGIALVHETSFQGGDGYVHFGTEALAFATLNRLVEAHMAPLQYDADDDAFYRESDTTLDIYRRVVGYQTDLLHDPVYSKALSALGMSLLHNTGSRKSKRQFEVAVDHGPSLRRIRAIPHNAILQQLGCLVNIFSGLGSAIGTDVTRFIDIARDSARAQSLLGLIRRAKALSSIKTLAAYGALYDGAFWATRPYAENEPHIRTACLYLADLLAEDDRYDTTLKLATKLRIDAVHLHHLLKRTGDIGAAGPDTGGRQRLDLLHALRLAVIQHIFLKAAAVPQFSTRNDVSREDIMELVLSLRVPEAVELLRIAYPREQLRAEDFPMEEETDYPDETAPRYDTINDDLIDPIEKAYDVALMISVAIAHEFGAHG